MILEQLSLEAAKKVIFVLELTSNKDLIKVQKILKGLYAILGGYLMIYEIFIVLCSVLLMVLLLAEGWNLL